MPDFRPELKELTRKILSEHPVDGRPMNPNEAETKTGISHTNIRDMANKGRVPRRDTLHRFAVGFGISRSGLLKAAGYTPTEEDLIWDREHYGGGTEAAPADTGEALTEVDREELDRLLKQLFRRVEWHPVSVVAVVSAGRAKWVQPEPGPIEEKHLPRVWVEGDSMVPVFRDGAVLEIDYGSNVRARDGDYVIAVRADTPVVKRLGIERRNGHKALVLYPINPAYDEEVIDSEIEHFWIPGVVRGKWKDPREELREQEEREFYARQVREQKRELAAQARAIAERDRKLLAERQRNAELEARIRELEGKAGGGG